MLELNTFDSIRIGLASPEKIREWSKGEVKKPETINYRTLKPEKEGLFCEKIFGPTKDWECNCGKYKRIRYKGVVCEKCGVEVTKAKVRRERMGHIELATPVSHIWYFKGIPSRMGLLLDMSPRALEKILYFASYVVTDPGDTDLFTKQLLSEFEYNEAYDKWGESFKVGMGAEVIKELLLDIDLEKESEELKEALMNSTGQKKVRLSRRLEVVESFRQSGNRPEWMIMDVIPVIPPDLRPMVQLEGGRFATSDLNDLYRRVINRNNRLKRLLDIGSPEIIIRNEKRMLQESVDALIDNGRRGKAVTGPGNRNLKSLSDMLKGKTGRFRQNLLGKRVDYSGRSVIVVGPELKFYQCGLPKKMAMELFKPFVMNQLVEDEIAPNIKSAKKMVERSSPKVWDILEKVIKDHPVLLNRAPTLHRLGIQAFEPVLVEGKAIKLHPLACTAYNADFDGDQMAVHLPLSTEAQAEARLLMMSTNNILAPKDGKPIATPSQDMVLGAFYLTTQKDGALGTGKVFNDFNEMYKAHYDKKVSLHATVKVRVKHGSDDKGELVESTVGRFIFNEGIPQDLGFINRDKDKYALEINKQVNKKALGEIVDKCFRKHGNIITAKVLDYIKSMGYKYSTIGALSISMSDVTVPEDKFSILDKADVEVRKYENMLKRGLVLEDERYERVIEIWERATDEVTETLLSNLDPDNNIAIMANSGARGSEKQIRQLAGMRGLMSSAAGKTIEVPIKANFREGLSVQEFFISTHGSRKGLSDTALRTADSGYLTRRLVDVSQDVIVRIDDCGTNKYILAKDILEGEEDVIVDSSIIGKILYADVKDGNKTLFTKNQAITEQMVSELEEKEIPTIKIWGVSDTLKQQIIGRYAFEDILNPDTGEIIVYKNGMITEQIADLIEEKKIYEVKIRSVLGCKATHGVCAKCYGRNLATGNPVNIGESVGIIAAQSIGEPGTQLTMRTFHSGGIAGTGITQGLPRVEELFEARKPKGLAFISENEGTVKLIDNKKRIDIAVTSDDGTEKVYAIPYGSRIKVKDGDQIKAGDILTEGSVNPHDILKIKGVQGVQDYIMREVLNVYRLQGVDIDYKHIEVIIKQMLGKVKIHDAGDSYFLPGSLVNLREFEDINEKLEEEGKVPAEGERTLLGITKASLATDSFLSAASFQETTRVLTDASIKGKEDYLLGLKENVIIGKLIPAGTGMKRYENIKIDYEGMRDEDATEAVMDEPTAEATDDIVGSIDEEDSEE
ncbi:DNA-directed RNA polymerase subunit beta' [Microaceticoccus formicicus]|uniref:DNA-directed RNA polymerase subunit beta' n=1 Tax=Microaceticoccus formicicus TaxID=3118105 RepID=UPI003CD01DF4|nr:DNA-directed RNA polymerase subunit beta' [Peptoniphilaceae bacterium AMB_02]